MSFQAMAKAVEIKLPFHEKFVLIMLANYANEEGRCWPAVATLASDTGLSVAAVKKALKKLVERGLITRQSQSKGGRRTSSIYCFQWGKPKGSNRAYSKAPIEP